MLWSDCSGLIGCRCHLWQPANRRVSILTVSSITPFTEHSKTGVVFQTNTQLTRYRLKNTFMSAIYRRFSRAQEGCRRLDEEWSSVRACVLACVRACVRACGRACARATYPLLREAAVPRAPPPACPWRRRGRRRQRAARRRGSPTRRTSTCARAPTTRRSECRVRAPACAPIRSNGCPVAAPGGASARPNRPATPGDHHAHYTVNSGAWHTATGAPL